MKFFDSIDFYGMKAEFVGTLVVVYCGGWAWMNSQLEAKKGYHMFEVGATHFLAYTLFVWTGYLFSGAMFNPAVTCLMLMFKKVSLPKGLFYIASQLLASLLGASMLKLICPDPQADKLKAVKFVGFPNMLKDGGMKRYIYITIYEAIGSAFVVIVYYLIIVSKRVGGRIQGIAVGAAYGAMTFSLGGITGAAVNPARIFGPAIVGKNYFDMLPYLVGDFSGAFLAGVLCELVLMKDANNMDMLKDKGAKIAEKEDEQFINQIPVYVRKNSDDDYFDGRLGDLETLDHREKAELELRKKTGAKKYYYNDSDEEGDENQGYLNNATATGKRDFVANIDEDNPLGKVDFELREGGEDVDALNIEQGDKKKKFAPMSGVDGIDMPAPMVVTEADGTVVEEARVLPAGYKPSDRGKTKQSEIKEDPREGDESSSDDDMM